MSSLSISRLTMTAMAMADKTVTISVPVDVLAVLDARAKLVKSSREEFIVDLLKASIGIIDGTVADHTGMIPVTIPFPIGTAYDYQMAATTMGADLVGLISAAVEHGRTMSLKSAREHVQAGNEPGTKKH